MGERGHSSPLHSPTVSVAASLGLSIVRTHKPQSHNSKVLYYTMNDEWDTWAFVFSGKKNEQIDYDNET